LATPTDPPPILETDRLLVRNWLERDRDLFFEINSDETVMRYFPMRRSRKESDTLFDYIQSLIAETGLGFYALELKETGETIGFCGLARTNLAPHIPLGQVEIGWRLATRFWGQGFISEAATALLAYGFKTHGLKEIVAFAVPDNIRSTAVMERIGMRRDNQAEFNHPRVPDDRSHLRRHVLYRLTAEEWRARGGG
jgi:RimJ/RimL family protein N-acetyltransferase